MLGKLIKNYRYQNNILQKDMAVKLKVSKAQMSKIERGIHPPKGDLTLRILHVLIPTLKNDLTYLEMMEEIKQ